MPRWLPLLVVLVWVHASQATIFNTDNRKAIDPKGNTPWSAIGKLWLPGGGNCTATLVGLDLLLTNAHCVLNLQTQQIKSGTFTFQPGFVRGQGPLEARSVDVWIGDTDAGTNVQNDWALIKLNWQIGRSVGHFGIDDSDPQVTLVNAGRDVYMGGYSDDFENGAVPTVQSCDIEMYDLPRRQFLHSCSGTIGASGAPILYFKGGVVSAKTSRLIAIHAHERRNGSPETVVGVSYSHAYANLAVPIHNLAAELKRARQRPLSSESPPR